MSAAVDWSKLEKFSGARKYFNISVLWIFYYRYVIRLLYYTGVHPHFVLFLSVLCGAISVYFLWYGKLIAAAILLHFKDIFDACDGSLARLTGKTTRIGRFLDSLGDMAILTAVIVVITIQAYSSGGQGYYIALGIFTWLSLFIQCSYFNFYQLSYAVSLGTANLNSRLDEGKTESSEFEGHPVLRLLQFIYRLTYGWQDRLVYHIDRLSCSIVEIYPDFNRDKWYRDKFFLTLNSALCFGTHIFVFMICFVFGNPTLALWIISIMFNIYFLAILPGRIICFKIRLARDASRDYMG
jgi:phosphatidylglycerophosphate synthase